MRLAAVAGLLFGLAAVLTMPAARADDLVGIYTVEGVDTDKSTYRGSVEISPEGDHFSAGWVIDGDEWQGVAIRDGDKLVVSTYDEEEEAAIVMIMTPDGRGGFVGRWAIAGDPRSGSEKWTPQGKRAAP